MSIFKNLKGVFAVVMVIVLSGCASNSKMNDGFDNISKTLASFKSEMAETTEVKVQQAKADQERYRRDAKIVEFQTTIVEYTSMTCERPDGGACKIQAAANNPVFPTNDTTKHDVGIAEAMAEVSIAEAKYGFWDNALGNAFKWGGIGWSVKTITDNMGHNTTVGGDMAGGDVNKNVSRDTLGAGAQVAGTSIAGPTQHTVNEAPDQVIGDGSTVFGDGGSTSDVDIAAGGHVAMEGGTVTAEENADVGNVDDNSNQGNVDS
ncbi:MAG: hypothetical protein DRQ47_07845, partial [Gammaproteobacteria bacterium]